LSSQNMEIPLKLVSSQAIEIVDG